MKPDKSLLLNKVGFVCFRGKWIPRFYARRIVTKLMFLCDKEGQEVRRELEAVLNGYDTATDK